MLRLSVQYISFIVSNVMNLLNVFVATANNPVASAGAPGIRATRFIDPGYSAPGGGGRRAPS